MSNNTLFLPASQILTKADRDFLNQMKINVDLQSDNYCLSFPDQITYSIIRCFNENYDIAFYHNDDCIVIINVSGKTFLINKLYDPVTKMFVGLDD